MVKHLKFLKYKCFYYYHYWINWQWKRDWVLICL